MRGSKSGHFSAHGRSSANDDLSINARKTGSSSFMLAITLHGRTCLRWKEGVTLQSEGETVLGQNLGRKANRTKIDVPKLYT